MSTLGQLRTSSRNYLSARERISQSFGGRVLEADTKIPSGRAEQTPSKGTVLALHGEEAQLLPSHGKDPSD